MRADSIGLIPSTGQATGPSELSLPLSRHSDEFHFPNEPINLSTDPTDTESRNQGTATAQKTQNLEDSLIHGLEKDIQEAVLSQMPDSSSNIIVRLILCITDGIFFKVRLHSSIAHQRTRLKVRIRLPCENVHILIY